MTSHFARLGTSNTPKLKYCDGQERSYCNLTISIVDCQSIQIPNPTPQHPACIQTDPNKPIYIPTLSKYNTYLSKPTPTSINTNTSNSIQLLSTITRPYHPTMMASASIVLVNAARRSSTMARQALVRTPFSSSRAMPAAARWMSTYYTPGAILHAVVIYFIVLWSARLGTNHR